MSEEPGRNRRLLVVGYYFQRTESSGGHRLHAMAKYLRRRHWRVTVLTVRRDSPWAQIPDEAIISKYIPSDTEVIRTRSFEFEHVLARMRRIGEWGSSPSTARACNRERRGSTWHIIGVLGHSLKTLIKWVNGILSFPDRQIGWFLPLLFSSWRLIRRQGIDVVVTSGPPHSCHLPFVLLKRLCNFKWVTDFRDPWTNPPFYAIHPLSLSKRPFRFLLNRWMEKLVLGRCDKIIANTKGNAEALREAFPEIDPDKIEVISNGFDEEICGSVGTLDESAVDCDFVFAGAMYPRMLDAYLSTLDSLRSNGYRPLPTLHIFGEVVQDLKQKVRDRGFESSIVFKGPISYEESLWVLSNAKALLLLFIAHEEVYRRSVPSKLYAYLFARTPYFALVPDGDAASILEAVGGGVVMKSMNPREIAAGMSLFLDSLQTGSFTYNVNADVLRDYSWERLSVRMDSCLRETCARRAGASSY